MVLPKKIHRSQFFRNSNRKTIESQIRMNENLRIYHKDHKSDISSGIKRSNNESFDLQKIVFKRSRPGNTD